jgi:predicted GIY-YIG superfamily endonuclease
MKNLGLNETYIYCLIDPCDNIGYIGKSDNPDRRYKSHLSQSKHKKYYKDRWIYSLIESSKKPEMLILDIVPFDNFGFW